MNPNLQRISDKDLRAYVESSHGLLAKWRIEKDKFQFARGHTFNGHLTEVMAACDFFFTEPYHGHESFGRALYTIMHLHKYVAFEDFRRWCELSALAHDLGKSSGEFQAMLWGLEHSYRKHRSDVSDLAEIRERMSKEYRYGQAYRHEFMSAVLLWKHPQIRAWFREQAGSDDGFGYVIAGAFGHHLKADVAKAVSAKPDRFLPGKYKPKPVFLKKLSQNLNILVTKRGLPAFPLLDDWTSTEPLLATEKSLKQVLKDMRADKEVFGIKYDNPVSGAVKWMVILADTFGSISQSVPKEGAPSESIADVRERIYSNLRRMFAPVNIGYKRRIVSRLFATAEELRKGQTAARAAGTETLTDEDVDELLMGTLRPMQIECLLPNGEDLICGAATGGGKTVVGLVWSQPDKRLIFTTTTTDTSTQLYFDYADGDDDTVRHSRSWMDVAREKKTAPRLLLPATPEDDSAEGAQEQNEANDAMLTLEGFETFATGITFTTVDQVLGVMAYYRSSVMWLLYIASAQIVFDEFHSYDKTMQAWYFRFLEWFPGIRTAHLSATVPRPLRARLEDTLTAAGKSFVSVSDKPGPGAARSVPRFRIHVITESEAREKFQTGSLWIVNTVLRCQQQARANPDSIAYHSRFRYTDRRHIRNRVIEMFRTLKDRRVIATQVAEMSFDISALNLLSELCPPASFIQRLGRVNRFEFPKSVVDVYVYLPSMEHGYPYSTKSKPEDFLLDYAKWMEFVEGLTGRDISQDDLEIAFQEFYEDPTNSLERDKEVFSSFLHTSRQSIRQGSITVPCILKSDLIKDPAMSKGSAKWCAIPAILGESDRRDIRDGVGVHEHHFIIDDEGHDWAYDDRLGLIDRKKLNP